MKIVIAGFQHETNTFAPTKADYENFVQGEGFPAMVRGEPLLALRDINIPAGGFIKAVEADGKAADGTRHTLIPLIWAGASPSAHVTVDAFERIAGEIVEGVTAAKNSAGGIDAVYLDLHGAMVTEHHDDGEGELLQRVRAAVGPGIPVVASLDLHANVTERMLSNADALVAYQTYPHVDMADTGARAAAALFEIVRQGPRAIKRVSRRLPFLIPINGMCTMLEPARGMYETLSALESSTSADKVTTLSFAPGFPAADFDECGATIWGYGGDEAALTAAVETLYQKMLAEEGLWTVPFLSPDEAVQQAMALARGADRPIVIADTQDNPGAGGDANTMGMLRALLRNGATDAALGLIWDPAVAAAAHAAGVGAHIDVSLGGVSGVAGDSPFEGRFEVLALSNGRCRYDGPMMNGMQADLGPSACLGIDGVKVVVSTVKTQMLDRNLFRLGNVDPEKMGILVNKSSVHFRADFQPIAAEVLVAKAPGPMVADPADLPWKKLKPGLRMRPNGPVFQPANA